jgi:DNA primase
MTTTAEESAAVATMLGFEVNRNFKFHVHSKDTEDFSIYKKNGMFKCWTGAFDGGDAIAFVMHTQVGFFRDVASLNGKPLNMIIDVEGGGSVEVKL